MVLLHALVHNLGALLTHGTLAADDSHGTRALDAHTLIVQLLESPHLRLVREIRVVCHLVSV